MGCWRCQLAVKFHGCAAGQTSVYTKELPPGAARSVFLDGLHCITTGGEACAPLEENCRALAGVDLSARRHVICSRQRPSTPARTTSTRQHACVGCIGVPWCFCDIHWWSKPCAWLSLGLPDSWPRRYSPQNRDCFCAALHPLAPAAYSAGQLAEAGRSTCRRRAFMPIAPPPAQAHRHWRDNSRNHTIIYPLHPASNPPLSPTSRHHLQRL